MRSTPATPAPKIKVLEAEFFKSIGYSTVWEDERVLSDGLTPRPGDRVFTITSGGCSSLHAVVCDAAEVISVDFNPNQTRLLELKVAAAAVLEYEELWQFLGLQPCDGRDALYARVRRELGESTRRFWDGRRRLIARGVTLCGKQDRYLLWIGRFIRLLQGGRRVERLLACRSVEEQERFIATDWDSFAWRRLCDVLFSRPVLHRAFAKEHFTYARTRDPARLFREEIDRLLTRVPVADNFYLYYAFHGRYPSTELCPAWLCRSSWEMLRSRLERVTLRTAPLEQELVRLPARSIDCFNLSNAFDWMSEDTFVRLMREVVRAARPGARLCYWTNIVNTKRELSLVGEARLVEMVELGERLSGLNRAPGYSGCVVARVEA